MSDMSRVERKRDREVECFLQQRADAPADFRISEALRVAAQLVEYSAFEGAHLMPPKSVAQLIEMAARLDTLSDQV